jgi:Ig-like domain from next to BRCA1 gene
MNRRNILVISILIVLVLVMAVFLRGSNQTTTKKPTTNYGDVRTAAVATFASNLTQTAAAQPTAVSTLTPTVAPTLISITGTVASATPTPSCYHLRWISDVTIPDLSPMNPGETFTKTWKVINNGTCAWQPGFQFAFYGGDPMGGSNYILTQPVSPGIQMDLSIPMTAPQGTGIVISTWRMSVNGWFFGDALTVKIDLGGETPTP